MQKTEKMTAAIGNSTVDYFSGLFENRTSKVAFMAIAIILMISSSIMCYSIVWYERYGLDTKQTMLNKLFAVLCWTGIEYTIFASLPDWLRYVIGPYPASFCWLHSIGKYGLIAKGLLLNIALIFTRYAYIFWLKNPQAFKDEFWCCFIKMWTYLFAFLTQTVFVCSPGFNNLKQFAVNTHNYDFFKKMFIPQSIYPRANDRNQF